jgi:hypothetical protein
MPDSLPLSQGGRGSDAGWIACSLCNARSQKRYAFGRGFKAHVSAIHPTADYAAVVQASLPTLSATGLSKSGQPNVSYRLSLPPACRAAQHGDLNALQHLEPAILKGEKDKFGASPLDWAAGEGHLDCVKHLLPLFPRRLPQQRWEEDEEEVPSVKVARRDGKTALHWACRNGQLAVVQYFIQAQYYRPSDIWSLRSGDGTTPLMVAVHAGQSALLTWIRQQEKDKEEEEESINVGEESYRCDWNARNDWNCSLEHFACMSTSFSRELLHFLMGLHSHPFPRIFIATNKEGLTPFHKWLLHAGYRQRDCLEAFWTLRQEERERRNALRERDTDTDTATETEKLPPIPQLVREAIEKTPPHPQDEVMLQYLCQATC